MVFRLLVADFGRNVITKLNKKHINIPQTHFQTTPVNHLNNSNTFPTKHLPNISNISIMFCSFWGMLEMHNMCNGMVAQ